MIKVLRRALEVLLICAGIAHTIIGGHAIASGPSVETQLEFIIDALHDGRAEDMQQLFPEGKFFSWALTGIAAARQAKNGINRDRNLAFVAEAVNVTGQAEVARHFGSSHRGVEHGAFYHGWRLVLLVAQARADEGIDRGPMLAEAYRLMLALDSDEPLTSYPGQAWPCDLVVAWAAVHQAADLEEIAGLEAAHQRLMGRIDSWRDPETGLIGHEFTNQGSVTLARGTSQAIINIFLPDIDRDGSHGELATNEWDGFNEHFVAERAGLIGVLEYPKGVVAGGGDVDSGPLIAGVSLSASAVGLGAARSHADITLASRLREQSKFFLSPVWTGAGFGTALVFGVLPVADAFLVFALTTPSPYSKAGLVPPSSERSTPWWYRIYSLPVLAVAGLGLVILSWREGARRAARPRSQQPRRHPIQPPTAFFT